MRKLLLIGIVIVFIFTMAFREDEKEIRVRIIPSSNLPKDIETKEEAKNIVVSYLNIIYDESYDDCMININNTYKDLEKVLDSEIGDVEVSFDKHTLYNKTYNDNAIKNTEAYTLYVVIGDGNGDNWWGSIYPKFLSVSGDTEVVYESLLLNVLKKIKEK